MVPQSKHNNVIILAYYILTLGVREEGACICVYVHYRNAGLGVRDMLVGCKGGPSWYRVMSVSVTQLGLIVKTWVS